MEKALIWKAFELHDFMFGYLYPTLLHMKPRERVIVKQKLNWKLIPWLIVGIFGISFFGVIPIVYILIGELCFHRAITSILHLTIYIGLLFANILPLAMCTVPLFIRDYVLAFNQILQWGKRLETEFPQLAKIVEMEDAQKPDLIGPFLCTTVLFMGSSPLGITIGSLIFDMDQFAYICEDVLPKPVEREAFKHILLPLIIRFTLVLILTIEGVRTLAHSFLLTTVYVNAITHGLRILAKIQSPSQFFVRYTRIRMANWVIRGTLGYIAAMYIIAGQVTTVVLLWMTAKGYEHVPSFIVYLLFPIMAFIVIAFTIIMFEQAIAIFEKSNELTGMWKMECMSRVPGNGTFNLKVSPEIRRVGRAQRPIAMTVGELRIIRQGFQIEYLNLVMDNFTNAVLLIEI